jgi:hypothetical protein
VRSSPRTTLLLACAAALCSATPARAQPAATPVPMDAVCPAIDEDGDLCAADLASGNCADFVAAAARLAGLYRAELERLPGSERSLQTTIWWGCGSANLRDVKELLVRIGTPRARAVLEDEAYRSLPDAAPATRSSATVAPAPDCDGLNAPSDRNACIDARLQAARVDHQRAFARCSALVVPLMRDDLRSEESTFQALLPERCDAQAADYDDPSQQTFIRSRCLVEALTERTRGMLEAHPECAAPDG